MTRSRFAQLLGSVVAASFFAVSAQAADVKAPSSANESAPSKANKPHQASGGTPTMPGSKPVSVNESAPSKAGKEPAGVVAVPGDNKNMPNPKTPSAANESAPSKVGKDNAAKKEKKSDTKY